MKVKLTFAIIMILSMLQASTFAEPTLQKLRNARIMQGCESNEYRFDESQKQNRCSNSCECDGARICSPAGWCINRCHLSSYQFNEAYLQNQCRNDCHCNGSRTCSPRGWCQGNAR